MLPTDSTWWQGRPNKKEGGNMGALDCSLAVATRDKMENFDRSLPQKNSNGDKNEMLV